MVAAVKKIGGGLDISYNLSTPKGMIAAAHQNLYGVMPKINTADYENSVGVVYTGGVEMDLDKAKGSPLPRKRKKKSGKAKRKKPKNTGKANNRKQV